MSKTLVIYVNFLHNVACQELSKNYGVIPKNISGTFLRHSVQGAAKKWTPKVLSCFFSATVWNFNLKFYRFI